MSKLTLFILPTCPYCIRVKQYLNELVSEEPKYLHVEIELIDEKQNRQCADRYDYYLVPTFYLGQTKLYEGIMDKAAVKKVLDIALAT